MFFEVSPISLLSLLEEDFGGVLGSILEPLGPILRGSWAILGHFGGQDGPKMAPRASQMESKAFPKRGKLGGISRQGSQGYPKVSKWRPQGLKNHRD